MQSPRIAFFSRQSACRVLSLLLLAYTFAGALAQSSTAPRPHDDVRSSRKTPVPSAQSNVPSRPATVILKDGSLTVAADNSDLTQILSQIATASGMTINGSVPNTRVFGVYGPQSTPQVLTALLDGAGANFMIVGHTDQGAPRQLLLTPRQSASAPSAAPNQGDSNPVSSPDAASSQQTPQPTSAGAPGTPNAPPPTADGEQPGPGAVVDVPPAPPDDPQQRAQQHLQQLQTQQEQLKQPPAQPQ